MARPLLYKTRMKNTFQSALLVSALTIGGSATVSAITITEGNIPQTDENILFNEAGLAAGPATEVQGISNNTDFIVNFSSGEQLTTPAQGQARIAGDFNDLDISLADATASFRSLILNVNADADGLIAFTVNYLIGNVFNSAQLALDATGENYFTITADGGERITSVSFDSTADVEDVRQVRIGGLGITTVGVPDGGATAALLGLGILSLTALRRKM